MDSMYANVFTAAKIRYFPVIVVLYHMQLLRYYKKVL
jgi:hypothetical protein